MSFAPWPHNLVARLRVSFAGNRQGKQAAWVIGHPRFLKAPKAKWARPFPSEATIFRAQDLAHKACNRLVFEFFFRSFGLLAPCKQGPSESLPGQVRHGQDRGVRARVPPTGGS